jgi:peptidoglycan/LPS O-acetylase OafA/YrhL
MQKKARVVWIEILRVISAFGILLYHTGLYYTDYAFTPAPNGLSANWQTLDSVLSDKFGHSFSAIAGFISVFSFQFLDVFILLIGVTMVLSWRGEENYLNYIKRRWLRVLWPFWLAVLFNLILSAFDNYFFDGYVAPSWNWFAAFTFPLAFDFHGKLLQHISGPWWFVPFMLAVIVISPFMLKKAEVWGIRNFLLFFGLIAFIYRLLSIYVFGAHTNYSTMKTIAGAAPFILLPAKIFLIALGIVFGKLIKEGHLPDNRIKLFFGALMLYLIGFLAQFYWLGWTVAEFFYAPAIVMMFYALFSEINQRFVTGLLTKLGALSYSFFLIHDFFANRLVKYFGIESLSAFWQTIFLSTVFSLIVAILIEKFISYFARACSDGWAYIDQKLMIKR